MVLRKTNKNRSCYLFNLRPSKRNASAHTRQPRRYVDW